MNRIKSIIKQYFTFNKRETRSFLSLAFLVLILNILIFLQHKTQSHFANFNITKADSSQLNSFFAALKAEENKPYLNRLDRYIEKRYDTISLFNFDPNTVSYKELLMLGFTTKQAKNVLNYRMRGGTFKNPDDFRKIYSIRTRQYQIVKPYIRILSTKKPPLDKTKDKPNEYEIFKFNPNEISKDSLLLLGFSKKTASILLKFRAKYPFNKKEDLLKIYGMDSALFSRIEDSIDIPRKEMKVYIPDVNKISANYLINRFKFSNKIAYYFVGYRRLLGGFYQKKQIYEVRGIDSLLAKGLIDSSTIDTNLIKKKNINMDDFYHPYMSKKAKYKLLRYRLSHDSIKNEKELLKTGIFTKQEWKRIKPYISY